MPGIDYHRWVQASWETNEIFSDAVLNVSGFVPATFGEGIGLRNTLFLQGCPKFCPGCKNLREKRMEVGMRWSVAETCSRLEDWRFAKLPSETLMPEEAYKKFLFLEALKHVAWEAINRPITARLVSKVPASEYCSLVEIMRFHIHGLCRGYSVKHGRADWPVVPVTGLTLSGGEALVQAGALRGLLEQVRQRFPELDVCIYSGVYGVEDILKDSRLLSVVQLSDTIKLGSFVWSKESTSQLYFGSRNQVLLDTRKSLELGKPVHTVVPVEVSAAMAWSERMAREKLVPRLRPKTVTVLRRVERNNASFASIEEFEETFGLVDQQLPDELFEFVSVEPPATQFGFLRQNEINILGVRSGPLQTAEEGCIEVYLQGSHHPPATDLGPGVSDLLPRKVVDIQELYEKFHKSKWYLRANCFGEEQEEFRLNLALQERLLQVQSAYFLMASPISQLSLDRYRQVVTSFRKQLSLFFNQNGQGTPLLRKVVFIRGGDPLLQAEPVVALADLVRREGYEVWLEIGQSMTVLRESEAGKSLLASCDVLVLGQSCDGGPPSVLPFISSPKQTVLWADSGKTWNPRYWWSKQISDFVSRFHEPAAIGKFSLSDQIAKHFEHEVPQVMSVEKFERTVGQIQVDWNE